MSFRREKDSTIKLYLTNEMQIVSYNTCEVLPNMNIPYDALTCKHVCYKRHIKGLDLFYYMGVFFLLEAVRMKKYTMFYGLSNHYLQQI